MAIGKPAGLTAQIGSSGGGTGGTTGGGGGGCSAYTYTQTQVYTYAYVDSPTGGPSVGFGGGPGTVSGFAGPAGSNPGSNLGSVISIQNADSAAQVCTLLTPGNNVYIEWHTSGTLVGGTFKFHILTATETLGSNNNSSWTPCNITFTDLPYLVTVTKQACQVASIDSRVAFSDADTPPTDANVSGRNLNFGSNIYQGGAFVGNMGPGNSQSDRSGTARLQMYPGLTTGLSNYAMVIASVLHSGDASYADGDMPVGAYCPATTDPNLPGTAGAATISNVTWASQWQIYPTPSWIFPPVYTTNPVSLTTLLGSSDTTLAGQTATVGSKIGDYASFVLTAVYDQPYTPTGGGTAYSTMAVTPMTAGQGICIACANEGSYQSHGTSLFHWLMNQNYPVTGLTYPYTDASPRLWLIQGTGIN
jgi:hypothetical protein